MSEIKFKDFPDIGMQFDFKSSEILNNLVEGFLDSSKKKVVGLCDTFDKDGKTVTTALYNIDAVDY